MGDVPVPQDWSDREAVEGGLRTQPREVCVALAARAALRVLPLLMETLERDADKRRRLIVLPSFRAFASSWVTIGHVGERPDVRAANAAAHSAAFDAWVAAEDASTDVAAAQAAADAAALAGVSFDAPRGAADVVARAAAAGLAACAADADSVIASGDARSLAQRPLWPEAPPDWAARAWADLRTHLSAAGEGWEVWTTWYDARLRGDPVDVTLETRRVIEPKRWGEGPKAVNAEIASIIADHRRERHSTVLARVAALEAEIASLRGASHGQIGHNGPPESIDVESPDIAPALAELKATTASPDEPSLAAAAVRRLGRALSAILNWSAAKADRFVDGCIDAGAVAAVGVITVAGLPEWATGLLARFGEVVEAVAAWLRSFGMAM